MRKNERRANHTIIAHSVDSTFIHQDVHEAAQEIFFLRFQPLCLVYWCWAVRMAWLLLSGAQCGEKIYCGWYLYCPSLRQRVLSCHYNIAASSHCPYSHWNLQCLYRVHQLCSAWNMEARGFSYRISDRFYHDPCHDPWYDLSNGDESLVVGITRAVCGWCEVMSAETLARCWWWLWSVLFWCLGVAGGGRPALCSPRCVPGQPAPPRRHLSAVGGTTTRLCTTAQQSEAILTSRCRSIFTRF